MVRVGTVLPFEQAPALLARLCDLAVSVSTVRARTEAAGAVVCAGAAAELAKLIATLPDAPLGAETQLLSVDGAMVPIVGGTWREVRTLAIGRVCHDARAGTTTTDQMSYFSRMTDAEHFAEAATVEGHRRGVEHARVVAAVADGAPWCQGFFDLHAPASVRILDFPHAVEHLAEAARAVFGEGSTDATTWLTQQRHDLRHGDPATVVNALRALPIERAPCPDEARLIRDREVAYFTHRQDQIAYADFSARGLPIGSGAVESANKLVVEARLKRAGMHWAPAHVDPMLALHSAHCSDRWHSAWSALCDHYRARSAPKLVTTRSVPPLPPPETPTPLPPILPKSPKTIVNGRPTKLHPWNQS